MRFEKVISLLLALTLIFTVFTSCSKPAAPADGGDGASTGEQVDKEQYINIALDAEPAILDSVRASDNYSGTILYNVIEPLTRLEEDEKQNNVLKPAGAASWDKSEDGLIWTFHLRDNKWSDGQPVKAQDYEYGIKKVLDPASGAPYSFLLLPIKNASAVNKGELPVDQLGVKALDDKTLEITLESPTAHFEALTYQTAMLPLRKDIVEKYGEKYGTEIDTMVFCGPFVMDSWTHNSEIVLKKNPNYWDNQTVKLETVNFKIIKELDARYNSLQNGSIDILEVTKSEWVDKFSQKEDLEKITIGLPTIYYEFFNTSDKLFSNVNVRKAFALGMKREELANVIFYGVHEAAYGWTPKEIQIGHKEYRSEVKEPLRTLAEENPDPKEFLKKGLQELGMDTDPSKLKVKMNLGGTNQRFKTMGEYFQQMYKETLGINLEIELLEWPIFSDKTSKYDFQLAYAAWGANFNDPICMMDLLKSDANVIYTKWENAKYDELINRAARSMDNAERLECFREAENILLYDEAALSPVVYPRTNYFIYEYAKNMPITPFGTQSLKYTYTVGRDK